MKTIEQARRELFEAWYEQYTAKGWSVSKIATWESFNAALDAVVIELPKSCAYETLDSARVFLQLTYEISADSADPVALVRLSDCRTAIESTNLGLKIR